MKPVLFGPAITEKSMSQITNNKYTFRVNKNANKAEITDAIEKLYKVNVVRVRVISLKGKVKNYRGKVSGRTKDNKKAIVTLKKGQKIADFTVKE